MVEEMVEVAMAAAMAAAAKAGAVMVGAMVVVMVVVMAGIMEAEKVVEMEAAMVVGEGVAVKGVTLRHDQSTARPPARRERRGACDYLMPRYPSRERCYLRPPMKKIKKHSPYSLLL